MANINAVVLCFSCYLLYLFACKAEILKISSKASKNTWCVARSGLKPGALEKYIGKICVKRGCKEIEREGQCHVALTWLNYKRRARKHASYYLNLDYRRNKTCTENGLARITYKDPSYGGCLYQGVTIPGA